MYGAVSWLSGFIQLGTNSTSQWNCTKVRANTWSLSRSEKYGRTPLVDHNFPCENSHTFWIYLLDIPFGCTFWIYHGIPHDIKQNHMDLSHIRYAHLYFDVSGPGYKSGDFFFNWFWCHPHLPVLHGQLKLRIEYPDRMILIFGSSSNLLHCLSGLDGPFSFKCVPIKKRGFSIALIDYGRLIYVNMNCLAALGN